MAYWESEIAVIEAGTTRTASSLQNTEATAARSLPTCDELSLEYVQVMLCVPPPVTGYCFAVADEEEPEDVWTTVPSMLTSILSWVASLLI